MSENSNESRLPPPAFPPGVRKHAHRNSHGPNHQQAPEKVDDGYYEPDDPMPERADPMGPAFISPDDPIPERKIELAEAFRGEAPTDPDDEGEVVGMDLESHLESDEIVSGGDPHVMEIMAAVGKLAEALKHRGEAGLRSSSEMNRFEATLRSYCLGYLVGRRAEEPPLPSVDEPLPSDG